ncbi:transmembrane protein 68-like isoform X4 [Mauremys mutica]|uniref:transmembrane protein 68-like isoform X4 n=1 Tax=Mauremys mutica TaxID=74926 RepID=UPI001D162219|nr:transmembrane protein 68-like isoform X4 [Mauremys mutica]
MNYEQLRRYWLVELCTERQLSPEDLMKTQLVGLLYSNEQKRNNGPGLQGTSSPLAEGTAGRVNLGASSWREAVHSGRDESVEILKKGNLLGVSPGGTREAFFSDENYNLLWGNRKGFAQVAIDAKVPIIPLFTQNIREGYRTFGKIGFFRWFYENSRLLLIPMYGGFPVKLRTYVGDPIPYDPNITATELVEKTKIAIEKLRDRHQKLPGSILRALLERFDNHQKED